MEHYDDNLLLAMASAVGKPIKVDYRTIEGSHGRFARVCVEINLDQPMVGRVWFRDKKMSLDLLGQNL